FTPARAQKLVANLHRALLPDGWLAVSPSECSQALFSHFTAVNFPGAIVYRKSTDSARELATPTIQPLTDLAKPTIQPLTDLATPTIQPPADLAPPSPAPTHIRQSPTDPTPPPDTLSARARALANEGKLHDALAWSTQWIAAAKVDPASHYLHAMILQ